MTDEVSSLSGEKVTCAGCKACCCRLDAMLFDDPAVPENLIEINAQGGMSMAQLADGWCAALDRKTMLCTIYELRPWICREFVMGESECLDARADYL